MKTWDTNMIVAWGLVVMGILAVLGWIAYAIVYGQSSGTEIPIAVSSGLGGVLTGKHLAKGETKNEP